MRTRLTVGLPPLATPITLQVGFDSFGTDLPADVSEEELLKVRLLG